ISQAIRAYDSAKGGKQTFPLFLLPGVSSKITLERSDNVDRSIKGRDFHFRRYVYSLFGLEIKVWADKEGKLYLADIPAQHASYVREGFEILRVVPETDPPLSKPTFEVKRESLSVPMRDGVALSTAIYRPNVEGKYPTILIRTPYKKEIMELKGLHHARRGYAVAIQDCRGRFGSPGVWEPFVHEPEDGYDTIEWLARQGWSNGKVGMIGGSYLGWVQWWAASQNPPHLVTIIPNVSPPDPFFNI